MLTQRVRQVWAWGSNLAGQLGQGFLGQGRFPHFHEEYPSTRMHRYVTYAYVWCIW